MGYKKKYKRALMEISRLEYRIIDMEYYKWIREQKKEFDEKKSIKESDEELTERLINLSKNQK